MVIRVLFLYKYKNVMKKLSEINDENLQEPYKKLLIKKLQSALAEEILAWYAYFIVKPFLYGDECKDIQDTFDKFANDELHDHAAWLIERINQLGGNAAPLTNTSDLTNIANHPYICLSAGKIPTLGALQTNIDMESGAIETYTDICYYSNNIDKITYEKAAEILGDEEKHLSTLQKYKNNINEKY